MFRAIYNVVNLILMSFPKNTTLWNCVNFSCKNTLDINNVRDIFQFTHLNVWLRSSVRVDVGVQENFLVNKIGVRKNVLIQISRINCIDIMTLHLMQWSECDSSLGAVVRVWPLIPVVQWSECDRSRGAVVRVWPFPWCSGHNVTLPLCSGHNVTLPLCSGQSVTILVVQS